MVPFLLKSFLECCDRDRSSDLIYIRLVCKLGHLTCHGRNIPENFHNFHKSHNRWAKSSEDRPPPCFCLLMGNDV